MRILLITQNFPPEIAASAARHSELARYWAESGHEVTVLTGMPNHPTGVIPPEYKGAVRREEQVDGHRVVRTWVYATPNTGLIRRTLNHLSFMVTTVLLGTGRVGRPDAVVVTSPPFFQVIGAWILSLIKRAPLVFEVRDLWPGIFEELGVIRNRRVLWLLERLELFMYRRARRVVVVTDAFKQTLVERGVPASKIDVIKNGVDLERFSPRAADDGIRRRLGAGPDDFLVLHIGAHGISHALESIADGAKLLAGRPRIRFAFVGEGARKVDLERKLSNDDITNAISLPGIPRDEVPGYVAAADLCLVPLRSIDAFEKWIPSKMFEFLGMAKPVLGSLAGEAAGILTDAGQTVVPPESPGDLAEAIAALADDPDRLGDMGIDGRRYVEEHFDRRALAHDYLDVLRRVTTA